MGNPGSISSRVPYGDDAIVRRQQDADRAAREQAAAKGLAASQIGAGGTLKVDGTLEVDGDLVVPAGSLTSPGGSMSAGIDVLAGRDVTAGRNVAATGSVGGASGSFTGDVTSGGQVFSQQPLRSPGSVTYHVTTGYVATWTNGDGTVGTSTSSGKVKIDLIPMTAEDADRLLQIPAYWGRYVWDAPDSPMKAFVLAEDVQAAGFGPDVAPIVPAEGPMNLGTDEDPILLEPGAAWTVNYSQLVVPLIAGYRALSDRVARLEG